MKILWITTKYPLPADSGGKIVTCNFIRELAKRGHNISLCPLLEHEHPEENFTELEGAELINPPDPTGSKLSEAKTKLSSLFSKKPYVINKYVSTKTLERIKLIIQDGSYDFVISDHLHSANYGLIANDRTEPRTILLEHNVETKFWNSLVNHERNPLKRQLYRHQLKRMRIYESESISNFDLCLSLSSVDKEELQSMNENSRLEHIRPGLDLDKYDFNPDGENGTVCFVGRLDWPPNSKGILWFAREIWPTVRSINSQAELFIVGANPPAKIRAFDSTPRIHVTGYVEEVRPYLARSQVSIIPVKAGSGVRIKLLYAWAMGKPVVSTPMGRQGLEATPGKNCLIADTPEEFSRSLIDLLDDSTLRRRLAKEGRRLVEKKYSAEKSGRKMEDILRRIAQ